MASDKTILLEMMAASYNRRSWHGATLRGSLRGLDWKRAAWRPAPDRRSIHEIVLHAAYWKYAVRRRLSGERRGSFPLTGSNWFDINPGSRNLWEAAVALLDDMHRQLVAEVTRLSSARLDRNRFLISGIIAHDLYHAGQIQLLKKLQKS